MTASQCTPVSTTTLTEWYRRMLLIRAFEQALDDLFTRGLIGGTSHFCIGQEGCAVGVTGAVRPDDVLVSNHRGHGHLLARGLDPVRVMAELLGRRTGYCGGRGGSQHMCAMDMHFLGTNGITGGGLPVAAGAALALKHRGADDIVVAFLGDGATNQGTFHETLNMASLWQLPVLFVCENNRYAMSMPVDRSMAVPCVAARAAAYAMPGEQADGMDVLAVHEQAAALAAQVRGGAGPALLELHTYRFCGHSKNDSCCYRTREEEECWRACDCIAVAAAHLQGRGTPQTALQTMEEETRARIETILSEARAAPVGTAADALGSVYA